jgi:predicted glutamine amidotransferase
MCRLTALTADVGHDHTIDIINQSMFLHATEDQRHGWGISDGVKVWKSEGIYGTNSSWMNGLSKNKIVIGHVRSASLNTGVSTLEAHPFIFRKFIGMHNGQFEATNIAPLLRHKDMPWSDSYFAFRWLNFDLSDKNEIGPTIIQNWLSNFWNTSTFAVMLLNDKAELIIVRDNIRKLFAFQINKSGWLIMSSEKKIFAMLDFVKNRLGHECSNIAEVPAKVMIKINYNKGTCEICRLHYRLQYLPLTETIRRSSIKLQ